MGNQSHPLIRPTSPGSCLRRLLSELQIFSDILYQSGCSSAPPNPSTIRSAIHNFHLHATVRYTSSINAILIKCFHQTPTMAQFNVFWFEAEIIYFWITIALLLELEPLDWMWSKAKVNLFPLSFHAISFHQKTFQSSKIFQTNNTNNCRQWSPNDASMSQSRYWQFMA